MTARRADQRSRALGWTGSPRAMTPIRTISPRMPSILARQAMVARKEPFLVIAGVYVRLLVPKVLLEVVGDES